MANFFDKAKDDAKGLEESLLGPDYKYFNYIKTPAEMGMSSNGSISTITNDIAGLIGYVSLLTSGEGEASKTGGPLGDKFFLETGAKCKDTASGESVTRSLYVNNVPDGSIPFISSGLGDVNFSEFKGLIPGTLSNLSQINPMQIFSAFMGGTTPDCQALTMETIDVNNEKGQKTAFVTNTDIKAMSACWFPDGKNPISGNSCRETFTTMSDAQEYNQYVNNYNKKYMQNRGEVTDFDTTAYDFSEYGIDNDDNAKAKGQKQQYDFSKMPQDPMIKIYYSSLSLLLLYIFYRVFKGRTH
jgi:hypothetical protein